MNDVLTVSISDACRVLGIGRSLLYQEISAGRLPVLKAGRRTIIKKSALENWIAGLSSPRPKSGEAA